MSSHGDWVLSAGVFLPCPALPCPASIVIAEVQGS